jgi:predicted DNA-binding transcriptional regulator AlpA
MSKTNTAATPQNTATSTQPLADKRRVAAYANLSVRTIDNLMAEGLPHLKIGRRRVRFDLPEVSTWLRQKYGVARIGQLTDN